MTEARRTRRARGSLTSEEILDAAEQVALDGFDALSMRAVAARVDAAPMALYHYYATKDELVSALLDRVLGRLEPPPVSDDWRSDLSAFARGHRRILAEHPWAVVPLFTHSSPGINAVRIGEMALQILDRAGLTGQDAVAAFSGLLAMNYGWSAFVRGREPANVEAVRSQLAALPASVFPRTVAVAEPMADYGSAEQYEIALRIWLDGLG